MMTHCEGCIIVFHELQKGHPSQFIQLFQAKMKKKTIIKHFKVAEHQNDCYNISLHFASEPSCLILPQKMKYIFKAIVKD